MTDISRRTPFAAVFAAACLVACGERPAAGPAVTLLSSDAYPAVRTPNDIVLSAQGDRYWAIVSGPDGVGLSESGKPPSTLYKKIAPLSLSRAPGSGQPLFFGEAADHDDDVGLLGPHRLPVRLSNALVGAPTHAGQAATPVYTSGDAGALQLHMGEVVGPISTQPPQWSADGQGSTFVHRYVRADGAWVVGPNGEVLGPYAYATDLTLSPDSKHFGFLFLRAGKAFVYMDGREAGGWDGAPEGVRFAKSATNFIGLVALGAKMGIATADKVFGPYESIGDMLAISADGTRYAFVEGSPGAVSVVTESGRGPPMRSVVALMYSPNGARLAYYGVDPAGKAVVVLDGKPNVLPRELDGESFAFDAAGRLVFTVQNGGGTDFYEDGLRTASLKGAATLIGRLPSGQAVLLAFGSDGGPIVSAGGAHTSVRAMCDSINKGNVVATPAGIVLLCRKGDRLNRVRVD